MVAHPIQVSVLDERGQEMLPCQRPNFVVFGKTRRIGICDQACYTDLVNKINASVEARLRIGAFYADHNAMIEFIATAATPVNDRIITVFGSPSEASCFQVKQPDSEAMILLIDTKRGSVWMTCAQVDTATVTKVEFLPDATDAGARWLTHFTFRGQEFAHTGLHHFRAGQNFTAYRADQRTAPLPL